MKDNKKYIKPEVEVSQVETILPIAASVSFGNGTTNSMDAPEFDGVWWDE